MRFFSIVLAAAGCVVFAGCDSTDSWSNRLSERFEPPQPQTRVYAAEPRAVFEAAKAAMRRIDFTVSRARAAEGVVEGHSALRSTDTFGKEMQYSLEVHFQPADEAGKTQVSVLLREQEESSAFAGATDIPVREHGLYDSYFAALERALKDANAIPTAADQAK